MDALTSFLDFFLSTLHRIRIRQWTNIEIRPPVGIIVGIIVLSHDEETNKPLLHLANGQTVPPSSGLGCRLLQCCKWTLLDIDRKFCKRSGHQVTPHPPHSVSSSLHPSLPSYIRSQLAEHGEARTGWRARSVLRACWDSYSAPWEAMSVCVCVCTYVSGPGRSVTPRRPYVVSTSSAIKTRAVLAA